ncbi:uncharacterized protein LOC124137130 [Haliotis rufescens]|uniref:uncharacterized protein LOC124137130 n=1 Tax=Haliotis rufescens TaxID=6454 RepID=UPI00201EC1DB|nr:uncharacterized protein LOC124137130 [Haliotis rufescens]XP_046359264.2 uncharacterized protein LOC124137130 [Haliotis rufescens]
MDRHHYHLSRHYPSHKRYSVRPLDYPELQITGATLLNTGLHVYETAYKVRHDPDHESINAVLARLENYQHHRGLPPVCVVCECQRNVQAAGKAKSALMALDSGDSDSDTDDEDALTIDNMLRLMERYMTRATSASQMKTMVRLINNHTITDYIMAEQVRKLQALLRRTKPELREAGLLLIEQLCCQEDNAVIMAEEEIFNDLLTVLSSPHSIRVQVAALKAADKLFSHSQVADKLMEAVDEVLMAVLLRVLYSEHPLEMKYASCCVLRTLSKHESTAGLVGQELLFIVKELKESSSKMKEVFVEIVINLYRQTDVIYPDMIDKNIIRSTTSMIVDGPCGVQRQALYLVCCLVEDDAEVADVINNKDLMLYVMQLMRDSKCRKVREVAGKIVQTMCGCRKGSLARTVMEHFTAFLHPEEDHLHQVGDTTARGSSKIVYPVRVKHQAEARNWQSFDQFLALIGKLITKHAMIKQDPLNKQLMIDDNPTTEWNCHQLGYLASLVAIATKLTQWPVEKTKSIQKLDPSDLTDDENMRNKLKGVNRQLTAEVWTTCGRQVAVLLSKFAEKVQIRCNPLSARPGSRQSMRCPSPMSGRRSKTPRGDILNDSEITLVKSLLEFFLFVSVATCTNKNFIKNTVVEKPERESVSRSREGLWVMENPHLTQSIERQSTTDAAEVIERRQQELAEKEASADRRLLRKGLYEEDLFRFVSPFVTFENEDLRETAAMILRCGIQPLDEKLVASDLHTSNGSNAGPVNVYKPRLRPQSAKTHKERDRKMNIALHRMSPEVAGVMRSAIGSRPSSADTYNVSQRNRSVSKFGRGQPTIDLTQPIAQQCRKVTVDNCGSQLLQGLFSKSRDVRKSCLLLIHDLVSHGNVETHMQLSELGCIPRLIDFLRINEDDEMLEIIAIILTRMLITSDYRLKQLFNRHGGANLLLSMSQNSSGVLREEIKSTLTALTQGMSRQTMRPSSAPAQRPDDGKEPDIWDNIMERWLYEDKVVRVFQKWM